EISQIVGMDEQRVREVITKARRSRKTAPKAPAGPIVAAGPTEMLPTDRRADGAPEAVPPIPYPPANEPTLAAERGLTQLMLAYPTFFPADWCGVQPDDFRHPAYRAICQTVLNLPFEADAWAQRVIDGTPDDNVKRLETELLVVPVMREPDAAYAAAYAAAVRLGRLTAQLDTLRARLQRMNPVTQADEQLPLFKQVVEMEAAKAALTRQAAGI
ncbi:MAG: hypothetical protein FWD63_08075, partial [Propionibacteriaceae bacterium]|nr:hypothetical protein [Propionibacteriaceae bacterium]